MSLTAVAFLPHSPLLIPEIGRANFNFLTKTTAAYQQIGQELKNQSIDDLIIISPHGLSAANSFTLNVAPEMEVILKDFGFIPPKTVFPGDAVLADEIKTALRSDFSLQMITEPILDYGSAIPIYLFKNFTPQTKIIVLSPADNLTAEEYLKFGAKLQAVIQTSSKKIAVIASGDLSHRLKRKSPGGYSPKGSKFDNKIIEYLNDPHQASRNIVKLDSNLIKAAGECGLKPLLIALGILQGINWKPEVLAYQTDFGIGYLSFKFNF